MSIKETFFHAVPLARRMRIFLRSCRGSIAPMVVLLTVPLVGMLGVATEGGSWLLMQRAMQNAADSAVIAAATNGGNGGTQTQYTSEADAVTASYGFTTGSNYATVTVAPPATYSAVTACASSPCYSVSITKAAPLYLLQVLGYTGNTTAGTSRAQSIVAGALATTVGVPGPFCLTALAGAGAKKGDAISANGVPKSSIGCNIQSAQNANCNGNNGLTSGWSDAVGTNNCGTSEHTVASVTDPYSGLKPNITKTCGSGPYPQIPTKKSQPALPSSNQWSSNSLPTTNICGDYQLTQNVTLTTSGTLVIENGSLDLNGHTLSTSGTGVGLTIILTGTNSTSYTHIIEDTAGGGVFNISSPTSGTWSGVAIYQDPGVAAQSITYTGNSPTFDISGIVYLPVTDFTASGAVNKSTNGYSCFTLVVNTLSISGTGDLFYSNPQSQCVQQGVTSPTNLANVIGKLVY